MDILINGRKIILPESLSGMRMDSIIYVDSKIAIFSKECIRSVNRFLLTEQKSCLKIRTKDEIYGMWKFSYGLYKAIKNRCLELEFDIYLDMMLVVSRRLYLITLSLVEIYITRFNILFNNCIGKIISGTFCELDMKHYTEILSYFHVTYDKERQISLLITRILDNVITKIILVDSLLCSRNYLSGYLRRIIVDGMNPLREST